MGISAVQYRIIIGCFQPSFRKTFKVQIRTQFSSRVMSWLHIFLCISILSPVISSSSIPSRNICDDKSTPVCFISDKGPTIRATVNSDSYFYVYKQGLNGFNSQETNKVCHSNHGNKNKPGIKIAAWNREEVLCQGTAIFQIK